MRRFGFSIFSLFALVALACLIALGTWQVKRLAWKENLIASVNERVAGEPVSLDEIEERFVDTLDVNYYPVRVSGRFIHEGEAHYLNTEKGVSGWNVYTPFQLNDGRILFVNRGFIPDALKDPASRMDGQLQGEVSFSGLSRTAPAEKPSSILPDNNLEKNQFFWRELSAMAANAGYQSGETLLPFFVDAGADATPSGGWPKGGTTRIVFPNNHLGYVITWYGLALALVGVYIAMVLKRRKERTV